jgi:hypothetical protein
MAFTFQGQSSVSWRWRTFRVTKHQQNKRKCWKISELVQKVRRRTIHKLADTNGISCGACLEILTENMNMCHIAPSSRQRTRLCIPENHRVCDWQHSYLSPSSLLVGLSCVISLFPKLKMKLKGWCFETVSDNQRESQVVLDSTGENDFHGTLEALEKMMGSLYTFPRRLFWKRWQTKLSKLSQLFFFDLVWELSDTLCIVFSQGNTYTQLCVKHCTSSCQYHPRHWPYHQHSTRYQARDRYKKFTVNLVTVPPYPTQAEEK